MSFGAKRLSVKSCRLGAAPKVLTRTAANIDWVSTRRIFHLVFQISQLQLLHRPNRLQQTTY